MSFDPAQLLDDLSTAVVVVDADRRVRYVNSAAEALFGASARTVVDNAIDGVLSDAPLPGQFARAI